MTALYHDPQNLEGSTYGKRWLRHQWQQIIEEQPTDNPETQKLVMAIHGGGIEAGTSELALATAGFDPATLMPSVDGLGIHDFWLFEGLLPQGNGRLHVTASNYDDPIATELVRNATRCISLHGCTDDQANGRFSLADSTSNFGTSCWKNCRPPTSKPRLQPTRCSTARGPITLPTRPALAVAHNSKWGRAFAGACSGSTPGLGGGTPRTTPSTDLLLPCGGRSVASLEVAVYPPASWVAAKPIQGLRIAVVRPTR